MNSFAVGRVLEPEVQKTIKGKLFVNFGLLVGKSSVEFSVWEDSRAFALAAEIKDGDNIIVICNSAVDSKGRLHTYVNDMAVAPVGLRETLLKLFVGQSEQSHQALVDGGPKK